MLDEEVLAQGLMRRDIVARAVVARLNHDDVGALWFDDHRLGFVVEGVLPLLRPDLLRIVTVVPHRLLFLLLPKGSGLLRRPLDARALEPVLALLAAANSEVHARELVLFGRIHVLVRVVEPVGQLMYVAAAWLLGLGGPLEVGDAVLLGELDQVDGAAVVALEARRLQRMRSQASRAVLRALFGLHPQHRETQLILIVFERDAGDGLADGIRVSELLRDSRWQF